jgi:hypothetical protein
MYSIRSLDFTDSFKDVRGGMAFSVAIVEQFSLNRSVFVENNGTRIGYTLYLFFSFRVHQLKSFDRITVWIR